MLIVTCLNKLDLYELEKFWPIKKIFDKNANAYIFGTELRLPEFLKNIKNAFETMAKRTFEPLRIYQKTTLQVFKPSPKSLHVSTDNNRNSVIMYVSIILLCGRFPQGSKEYQIYMTIEPQNGVIDNIFKNNRRLCAHAIKTSNEDEASSFLKKLFSPIKDSTIDTESIIDVSIFNSVIDLTNFNKIA